MTNGIIFKIISTRSNYYAYDRHTNAIIKLTNDEYNELDKVQLGKIPPSQSEVIKKYQEQGMFMPNVIQKIRHPKSDILKYHAENKLHQLILQVTQQCNLRCAYCVYSGNYKYTRVHSNKRMSFDMAKRAIDFFLARSTENAVGTIGFYGGEPLLEFGLIKESIEYVNSQIDGKVIHFNMTTNGTLLTDSIVDFLVDNDVQLNISLDGSKYEHDANRKFPNGDGSFDLIIDNIKRIKNRYPEYEKKINFMTTINPNNDLSCVLEFFNNDRTLSDNHVVFSSLVEKNVKETPIYSKECIELKRYEYIKMLLYLSGKLDRKYVSKMMLPSVGQFSSMEDNIHDHDVLNPVFHHGGPCLPGIQRLFVRVDGVFYPCERVSEGQDFYQIGSLDDGFDYEKMEKILNIGTITASECTDCWNLRNCSMCSNQIEFEAEPTKEAKRLECKNICKNALSDMYELCVLSEFGYKG